MNEAKFGFPGKLKPTKTNQKITDAVDSEINASGFDGNLTTDTTDVQLLAQAVDDLDTGSSAAVDITQSSSNQNGLINGALNVQVALDRIDATGLGAPIIPFTGSFIATDSNLNAWFSDRQNVILEHTSGGTNAIRTFTLPGFDGLNAMFDVLQTRGVAERFTITIGYLGGSSTNINRNALRIQAPSVSTGFDRTELPTTLAQGSSATFTVSRVGGVISMWERQGVQEAPSSQDTFGDLEFQTLPWSNSDLSFLPASNQVQKGYAFKVINSNPNDGSLRQGLIDSGVTDKVVYNDDWIVWIADAFTSWTNGDDWFVLSADDVRRISQTASNFLTNVNERDSRPDMGTAENLGAQNALVWVSPVQMTLPPFLNPNTDPNNPRPNANGERYYGGTFNRNGQSFQFGSNLFGHFLYTGITPQFVTTHGADNIDIVIRDIDGVQLQRFNLATDFTQVDDANFSNSTVSHFFRSQSFNYPSLATIDIVLVTTLREFSLNSNVDVTPNVSNLQRVQLSSDIQNLLKRIDNLPTSNVPNFSSIIDRVSPYRDLQINTPDTDVYFKTSNTPSESFQNTLVGLTQVNAENPRLTTSGTVLFLYVEGGDAYTIMNITSPNNSFPLDTSLPNIEIGVSFQANNKTYFGYRITGLTNGDILEVDNFRLEQVVAWQNDIDNLIADVNRIDVELKHAVLDLPDDVVQVLENEVTVTEEDKASISASNYNKSFTTNDQQAIFYEATPNAPSGGTIASKPINETTGARARRKLIYYPQGTVFGNGAVLSTNDGSTTKDILQYVNGSFSALVFVPGTTAGGQQVTVYPTPSNLVRHDWYSIALKTSNLEPEADELFFTRDVPTAPTTVNFRYRYDANGGHGNTLTTTLVISDINQDVNQFVNLALPNGDNIAVTFQWRASQRVLVVQASPQTGASLFIFDMEVGVDFLEERTIPAIPDTERLVEIEGESTGDNVFAIKPSSTNTLIIVGDEREIDTKFAYTDLFSANESGFLVSNYGNSTFLDYENFSPSASTLLDLENHSTLPQFGLFTTQYTHETVVELGTQLIIHDSLGNRFNVGDALRELGATKL